MKLVAIGDIHGRPVWKEILKQENDADKYIFIGDYFDSHENISGNQQLINFRELLTTAYELKERMILLIGNHDYHYLNYTDRKYSGYQYSLASEIRNLIYAGIDQAKMIPCYVYEDLAFTHAGITATWAASNGIDLNFLQKSMNELFRSTPSRYDFTPGSLHDVTGNEVTQSPLWVRPPSLVENKIEGYIQVVGHTIQSHIRSEEGIYLIDTLGTSQEYLVYEDGGFSVNEF